MSNWINITNRMPEASPDKVYDVANDNGEIGSAIFSEGSGFRCFDPGPEIKFIEFGQVVRWRETGTRIIGAKQESKPNQETSIARRSRFLLPVGVFSLIMIIIYEVFK